MKSCIHCAQQFPDNTNFCSNCGKTDAAQLINEHVFKNLYYKCRLVWKGIYIHIYIYTTLLIFYCDSIASLNTLACSIWQVNIDINQ